MTKLLTVEEVAQLLGVKKSTVYAWIHKHMIPYIKMSRRLVKFREDEIEAWLEEKSFRPPIKKTQQAITVRRKRTRSVYNESLDRIIENAKREYL